MDRPHPMTLMKTLLLLPILALAFVTNSCRTVTPIDPMTMKQSCRCLPEHFHAQNDCHHHLIVATK